MNRRFACPFPLRLPRRLPFTGPLSRGCTYPAALAVLGGFLAPLHAAERYWITPAGGSFNSTANWSSTDGGGGGFSVPGAIDVTNFTLNSAYTVTFTAAPTTSQLVVDSGNVTFALGGLNYTVTNSSGMFIGNAPGQTGRLTVREGILRTDTAGDNVHVGAIAGGTGFLTIGADASLGTAGLRPNLFVGGPGTGTLSVTDNGHVYGAILSLANVFGTAGTLSVAGPSAVVDIQGTTTIGESGAGTVSVTSGGTLVTPGVILAIETGGDGTATVSGIGSSWTMGSSTTIGSNGDGALTVSNGGLVTSASTVALGTQPTGAGGATVTGTGSQWNITGIQTIATSGTGAMTISNGGGVSASAGVVGANAGAAGLRTGKRASLGMEPEHHAQRGPQWQRGIAGIRGRSGHGGGREPRARVRQWQRRGHHHRGWLQTAEHGGSNYCHRRHRDAPCDQRRGSLHLLQSAPEHRRRPARLRRRQHLRGGRIHE